MTAADDEEGRGGAPAQLVVQVQPDTQRHKHEDQRRRNTHFELSDSRNPEVQSSGQYPHLQTIYNHATKAEVSWWYLLCFKCRQKESGSGWEPPFWQSICPYPFCPAYRHIAGCLAVVLLVLLAWGIVYSVLGEDAAPGGQLFDIARLVISAYFGGYLFRIFNLPGLIGMILVGTVYQNLGLINVHDEYIHVCAIVRKIALVIILTRAGLDLDPKAMRRLFVTILKVGLVPWAAEAMVVAAAACFFLDFPLMWGALLGSLLAAVAPAVIVACLFRLRSKGYGVAKGIPTVVIAVSGMDDAASVAAFSIIQSLMFSENSLLYNVILGLVSLFGGIGVGILWGLLTKFIPEKGDPFVVPSRILLMLGGGLLAILGSERIDMEGAGPLAVISAAFVSSWIWSTQGWDIEDNPVATAFEIFWIIIEPILFSLTGTQIRISELEPEVFSVGVSCIIGAAVLRMAVTMMVAFGESFNTKEKAFFALALMAKASVQAALGPVPLDMIKKLGPSRSGEQRYAELLLMMCVLSIAISAPVGAVLITLCGPRLLTKTTPGPPEEWRKGPRPSMRDITVVDEGKEEDDIERRPSHSSQRKSLRPPNLVVSEHL